MRFDLSRASHCFGASTEDSRGPGRGASASCVVGRLTLPCSESSGLAVSAAAGPTAEDRKEGRTYKSTRKVTHGGGAVV